MIVLFAKRALRARLPFAPNTRFARGYKGQPSRALDDAGLPTVASERSERFGEG
jgi:hypothetical protein